MKRTIASAAAIALIAGTAGPAFAKAHNQPADPAMFGQRTVAAGQFDEPNNLDARGLLPDDEKGVDGDETSTDARTKDAPVFETPAQPSPQD